MNSHLQNFSEFIDNQYANLTGSWRSGPACCSVGFSHAHGLRVLILIALLVVCPTIANELSGNSSDFDEDGVPDHLDFDQDNDGILNSDEGYVSFSDLADYPADSYVLLPDAVVTAIEMAASQTAGSTFRYPLLNSRGVPSLDFVGNVLRTDTRIDWAMQQQLPKLKHLGAGQTEVRWQFMRFRTDEQVTVDIDMTVGDLDGNRSEGVTIDVGDIAGYSVSAATNLQIDDTVAGKLVFTATGESDNTENDAVVLHLRNVSEVSVTYNSSSNENVMPGLDNDAAGFRHSFTAGVFDIYIPAPIVRHTDNDGYPDHRDLDSNNDGLPDVEADVDVNRDGMVDGPVDSNGVPAKEEEGVTDSSQSGEQLAEEQAAVEQQIGAPLAPVHPSPASATLNIISDLDRDSIADIVEGAGDADGDGVPNQYDLDSDNDGLTDLIEAGAVDADHNGVIDDAADALVKTYTTVVPDFDNDGLPDFLDSDSDQDAKFDLVEAGGIDLDGNGTIDDLIDQNGDGWDDRFLISPLPLPDTDNDGNPDTLDNDGSVPNTVVLEDFQQLPEDVSVNDDIVTGGGSRMCDKYWPTSDGPDALGAVIGITLLLLEKTGCA